MSYLTRVRHGSAMTQTEQADAWSRTRDHLRSVLHNLGSRVQYEDSHGSSQASSSFQCPASTHETTFQPDLPHQYFSTGGNVYTSFQSNELMLYIY